MKRNTTMTVMQYLEAKDKTDKVLFQRLNNKLYAFVIRGEDLYWNVVTDQNMIFLRKTSADAYLSPFPFPRKKAA